MPPSLPLNPMASRLRAAIRVVESAAAAAALASGAFAASPYILPCLSSSIRGASAWIAVQLIVLVVWKLSRHKPLAEHPPTLVDRKPSWQDIPVSSMDTPVSEKDYSAQILEIKKPTTEEEEEELIELPPAAGRGPEMRKSATVKEGRRRRAEETRIPPRPPPEIVCVKEEEVEKQEDKSMEATWNAIMAGSASPGRPPLRRKSETWEMPPPQGGRPAMRKSATFREGRRGEGWRGREALVVGRDELFGRVEAFIQMHYDHLRLQRQESEQRRFTEMVGPAY